MFERILNRILASCAVPLVLGAVLVATPATAYQLGDTVADFTLDDLQANPVSLSDYAGNIVLINFFATWCPGCNEEAAILENDIHLVYRDYGVTVIAIDMQEPDWLVADWAAAQGVTYQILLAPDWNLFSQFPMAGGLPYNAIIDREGVLRYGQVLFDRDALLGTLNMLLGFDPVPVATSSFGAIKALYR